MDEKMIPYFCHEGDMARAERTIKRLWILCIMLIILLVGTNAGWIYFESQCEDTYPEQKTEPAFYQMASGKNPVIEYDSGTEFSRAVNGRDPSEIIPVFDELMTTLQVLHPRLYDGVLNKL